jgi:hypothetical protein
LEDATFSMARNSLAMTGSGRPFRQDSGWVAQPIVEHIPPAAVLDTN